MTGHKEDAAQAVIAELGLVPHHEGGWYREIWRSKAEDGTGLETRGLASTIYYLLEAGQRSHWHRIDAAEIWLWHAGHPLTLLIAETDRDTPVAHALGGDVTLGQRPQVLVPAHHWQSAEALYGWALVSCLVSPGFDFAGWDLAAPGWKPGL